MAEDEQPRSKSETAARRYGQSGAPGPQPGTRRTYRAGGVGVGASSAQGPGEHGFDDAGARSASQSATPSTDDPHPSGATPRESQRQQTYGTPSGDLGRSWSRPDERKYGQSGRSAGYEGWSGRTGQDYQPEGRQSFEHRSGAWTRGGVASGAPAERWHDRGPDAEQVSPAGQPGQFAGEAAYNQQFREPYGAYQGGYPGEAAAGAKKHAPEYLAWRAEQIRKLDDDYEAWCRERQTAFEQEFARWREGRGREQGQPAETRSGEQGEPPPGEGDA